MANTNKNLVNLATGKKPAAKKPQTKAKATKPPTAEEERNLKAKAKVEELLSDVKLTPDSKDDLLELAPEEEEKGSDWLQEQVALLSSENEALKIELKTAKEDYARIFAKGGGQSDSEFKETIVKVFHELQSNYLNMGMSPSGEPNFRIAPAAFINRLIVFFPFLQKEKKF